MVDLLAGGEHLVQLHGPDDGAQRGLSQLAGGQDVVLDLDDGVGRVQNPEVDHRVDLDGHVVLGDDLLDGNVHGQDAQVHAYGAVDDRDEEDDAGPAAAGQPSEPEDDQPLVLRHDPDGRGQDQQHDEQNADPAADVREQRRQFVHVDDHE